MKHCTICGTTIPPEELPNDVSDDMLVCYECCSSGGGDSLVPLNFDEDSGELYYEPDVEDVLWDPEDGC